MFLSRFKIPCRFRGRLERLCDADRTFLPHKRRMCKQKTARGVVR